MVECSNNVAAEGRRPGEIGIFLFINIYKCANLFVKVFTNKETAILDESHGKRNLGDNQPWIMYTFKSCLDTPCDVPYSTIPLQYVMKE